MKKFIQKTADASFYQDNLSLAFRKTHLEYVFELGKGWYGFVNLVRLPQGILLFTYWDDFFDKFCQELEAGDIRFIDDECKLLLNILEGKNPNINIAAITNPETRLKTKALASIVNSDVTCIDVELAGRKEIWKRAEILMDTSLKVYHELRKAKDANIDTLIKSF